MKAARGCGVPVHALIRPRAGGFVYTDFELDVMLNDIAAARDLGLHGVVFGALTASGNLHEAQLQRLIEASAGLDITLHRAFDVATLPISQTVEQAIALGFDRILTSGRAPSARQGVVNLRAAIAQAQGRICIMPGGGLRAEVIGAFVKAVPVREVHSSCAVRIDDSETGFDFIRSAARRTDQGEVAAMKAALGRS